MATVMKRGMVVILSLAALLVGGVARAAGAQGVQGPVQHVVGDVVVPAGAVVRGDVAVAVGHVRVDGTVTGSVSVGVGSVVVDGQIDGDVHVGVGQIQYGPRGRVGGVTEIGMASSPGRLPRRRPLPFGFALAGFGRLRPLSGLLRWFGSVAIALPVVALFPDAVAAATAQAGREPLRAGLLGLAAIVLAVPIFILVALTIVGIPVAVLAAIALVAAIFFGYVAVAVWIGEAVLVALRRPGSSRLWALLAGSLLVALAGLVPIVGGLVSVAVSAIGLGAVFLWRFRALRGGTAA